MRVKFVCDICNREWDTQELAKKCEERAQPNVYFINGATYEHQYGWGGSFVVATVNKIIQEGHTWRIEFSGIINYNEVGEERDPTHPLNVLYVDNGYNENYYARYYPLAKNRNIYCIDDLELLTTLTCGFCKKDSNVKVDVTGGKLTNCEHCGEKFILKSVWNRPRIGE